jgi:hypothetical protein
LTSTLMKEAAMSSSPSPTQQEGIMRRVNEAIREGFWPGEDDQVVRVRCECGRPGCNGFVTMRVRDYQRLRAQPRRFVICAGHETPAIERVVARDDGCEIVEKTGEAADRAERSDPRREAAEPRAGDDPRDG